jgi:hypothetical protein
LRSHCKNQVGRHFSFIILQASSFIRFWSLCLLSSLGIDVISSGLFVFETTFFATFSYYCFFWIGFLFIMRGLVKASLLLAPALASTAVVPNVDVEDIEVDRVIAGKMTPPRQGIVELTRTSFKIIPSLSSVSKSQ